MTAKPHITFILNPAAGRGKAEHIFLPLKTALASSGISHTLHRTAAPGEATGYARAASEGSSIIVAVGGDGTVNEVASGLVGTSSAMAVMGEGSGNDFARIVNAPNDPASILALLGRPVVKAFDTGVARIQHIDGSVTERNFFNSVGLGFDAAVAKKVSSIRWLRGIPLYLTALLRTIAGYRPHTFVVTSNRRSWKKNYFLLCIGNGKWEGGGFKLTPNAIPDDGLFDVCGVTGDSVLKVLPLLPSVMSGTHIGKEHIEFFVTEHIVIESDRPFPVHGDGEIFGWDVKKIEISIRKRSLNVITNGR